MGVVCLLAVVEAAIAVCIGHVKMYMCFVGKMSRNCVLLGAAGVWRLAWAAVAAGGVPGEGWLLLG